jgi:hypothetical protein
LFDVTNVWSNLDPKLDAKSFSINPYDISMLIDFNSNQFQYQHQKSYVKPKHEFSNCESNWKPVLYRYTIDNLRNKIESIQEIQLNDNPYVSIFPNTSNTNYDVENQREFVKQGYVQFIPICIACESTSYEYDISLNDRNIAFDVYFVPSQDEMINYLKSDSFRFYAQEEDV